MLTLLTQWLFFYLLMGRDHDKFLRILHEELREKNLTIGAEEKDAHGEPRTRCILTSLLYVHIGPPNVSCLRAEHFR